MMGASSSCCRNSEEEKQVVIDTKKDDGSKYKVQEESSEEEEQTRKKKGPKKQVQEELKANENQKIQEEMKDDELSLKCTLKKFKVQHNIPYMKSLEDCYNQEKKEFNNELVFVENKGLISSKIALEQLQTNKSFKEIENLLTENQTTFTVQSDQISQLSDSQKLKDFLRDNSQKLKQIIDIYKLAEGGEAIVYRVEHSANEEIVAKCPIFKELNEADQNKIYCGILEESQRLRVLADKNFIPKVVEEIVLFNKESGRVISYVVLVEQAQNTLVGMVDHWVKSQKVNKRNDWYSEEKVTFYYLQALIGLEWLHQQNIYYGDIKPANMLVYRDQKVKYGDFGISFRLNLDDQEGTEPLYDVVGITNGFCTQKVVQAYDNGDILSKNELFENDKFAIETSFLQLNKMLSVLKIDKNSDTKYERLTYDIKELGLNETIKRWLVYCSDSPQFLLNFAQQLNQENKPSGVRYVLDYSKYKNFLQSIESKHELEQIHQTHLILNDFDQQSIYPMIQVDQGDKDLYLLKTLLQILESKQWWNGENNKYYPKLLQYLYTADKSFEYYEEGQSFMNLLKKEQQEALKIINENQERYNAFIQKRAYQIVKTQEYNMNLDVLKLIKHTGIEQDLLHINFTIIMIVLGNNLKDNGEIIVEQSETLLPLARKMEDMVKEMKIIMRLLSALHWLGRQEERRLILKEIEPIVTREDDRDVGAHTMIGINYLEQLYLLKRETNEDPVDQINISKMILQRTLDQFGEQEALSQYEGLGKALIKIKDKKGLSYLLKKFNPKEYRQQLLRITCFAQVCEPEELIEAISTFRLMNATAPATLEGHKELFRLLYNLGRFQNQSEQVNGLKHLAANCKIYAFLLFDNDIYEQIVRMHIYTQQEQDNAMQIDVWDRIPLLCTLFQRLLKQDQDPSHINFQDMLSNTKQAMKDRDFNKMIEFIHLIIKEKGCNLTTQQMMLIQEGFEAYINEKQMKVKSLEEQKNPELKECKEQIIGEYQQLYSKISQDGFRLSEGLEGKVFLQRLLGDIQMQIALNSSDSVQVQAIEEAKKRYNQAQDFCSKLPPYSMQALYIANNYSKFLSEVLHQQDEAEEFALNAIAAVENKLSDIDSQDRASVIAMMEKLKRISSK